MDIKKVTKTCGTCRFTDCNLYFTNPPKVRCSMTGQINTMDHECDVVGYHALSEILRQYN